MFIDLHHECFQLKSNKVDERSNELAARLPPVALCAVGGFPFTHNKEGFYWCGNLVTAETITKNIIDALGLSAVLTYTNKNNKSLKDLGTICLEKQHCWGLHWVTVSLLFSGFAPEVELAFARDTRFRLSWIVKPGVNGQVFMATAGIKEWLGYTKHRDDNSFDMATRVAMQKSFDILKKLLP